jgi:MFS family permease
MHTQEKLEANIWKYGLYLVTNKRIFAAILGAFYLTIPGVTPTILGVIMLAGSLSSFAFEIPSGYLSDKMGHKNAIIFSRLLVLTSTLLFLFADSITFLVLAGVFMSAGHSFLSGTGSAFMHETLRALGRESEYTKIMGKVSSLGFAIPVLLTAAVPFLINISYKLPFVVGLILDVIGLVVAISLTKPNTKPVEIAEINSKNLFQVLRESAQLNLLPVALVSGILGGMLFVAGGFRAPYQTLLEIPVIWFGVFHGIGRILASLMLAYSDVIRDLFPFKRFYSAQILLYTFLLSSLFVIESVPYVVTVFILLNAFQWGLGQVDSGYQLDLVRTHSHKATLLSISSQFDHMTAIVFGVLIGVVIEYTTYQTGFLVMATALLVILVPLTMRIRAPRPTSAV